MQSPPGPGPSPFLTARILRLALAASVVVYGVLAIFLRDRMPPSDLPPALFTVLHVAAGALVLAGVWVFRRTETSLVARRREPRQQPGPALPAGMVAGWALFESVGVLGLVVSLLGGTGQVLVLVSLLLILLHPPRQEWFS